MKNFKEWLNEMSWISPTNITLKGHRISMIDMKFETYPEEEKKNLAVWMQKFSAPLKNGEFLNYSENKAFVSRYPLPAVPLLPVNWSTYAYIVYIDGTTKEPGVAM